MYPDPAKPLSQRSYSIDPRMAETFQQKQFLLHEHLGSEIDVPEVLWNPPRAKKKQNKYGPHHLVSLNMGTGSLKLQGSETF